MNRRRVLTRGLAVAGGGMALGALPACSLGVFQSPVHLVRLTAAREFAPAPPVGWQLMAGMPTSSNVLNTTRVPLKFTEGDFSYYDAEWQDPLPEMLQRLLIESFENSGRVVGVGRDGVGLRGDYALMVDVRDFQAEYPHNSVDEVPSVHIRLRCKLVTLPRRVIQESQGFEVRVTAKGAAFADVLAAFDDAFHTVARQVTEWALRPGRRVSGGV